MTLGTKDLIESNCKCGKVKKEILPQHKVNAEVAAKEQERIIALLNTYHNAAWRRHHLEAIIKLIKGE